MSRYGRIESGFWQSRKVRRLSDDARYLMLYLLSCPHGNAVGCFVLHDGYISADMGWETERVEIAFMDLSAGGLAERDENTLLTRICGWWGHNAIENANVAKHVLKEIALLPDCPVKDRLVADLRGRREFHETVIETVSKGFPEPYRNQNLTEQNRNSMSADTDTPSEVPKEIPPGTVLKFGKPLELELPVIRTDAEFAEWYAAYPRREARGKALKAYKAARKKVSREILLEAVRQKRPEFSDPQFTPLPASWLNAERWADENRSKKGRLEGVV